MKILVTGSTGFVGRNLVKKLIEKKHQVITIVKEKQKNKTGIQTIYGDIRNKESIKKAFKKVDVVIHLAAVHGDLTLQKLNETNFYGTKNIIELASENKIKHLIYYSSVAVYGEEIDITENSKYNPYDNYGKSKKQTEDFIDEFKKKNDMPITTIQPAHIYGPGGISNINNLLKTINKRLFVIFGSGKNLINVVYIDDLTDITIKIIKNKRSYGQKYIISDYRPYTLKELSYEIAKVCRTNKPIRIPYFIGYILGLKFDIIHKILRKKMPISRSRVKNISRSRSFIIKKAEKELNYSPKTHLKEGMESTYKWYKEKNLL